MIIKYVQNFLFLSMISVYVYVIYIVYNYYTKNDGSISSILQNNDCNKIVFTNITIMNLLTIFYELLRFDVLSFFSIVFIVIGIYGVLLYDHTQSIHFIFCFIVFISILLFMYNHCYKKHHIILYLSLYIQEILCAKIFLDTNIINCEIYLLANFAFFYTYLHLTN